MAHQTGYFSCLIKIGHISIIKDYHEPSWHRRLRRQRAVARTLLRVAAARRLLSAHHSAQRSMPASSPSQPQPQQRSWQWRWTCVTCGNYNASGEHCVRCKQHWTGKTPPRRGPSVRRRTGGSGGSGNSSSAAHPSSWRSSADPTGGAAPRRSRSQEPKPKPDQVDRDTTDDRQSWVKKEISSQVERGHHHVRILTPEEALLHPQYVAPPCHRKDKAACEEYTRVQRGKLQQALANFRTQIELNNDLTEAEGLVGLHRRTVYAALPIPEQLTQYERVCATTEAKMEYCKTQVEHYRKMFDRASTLLVSLQRDHQSLMESTTQLHQFAMKEQLAEEMEDDELNEAADAFQRQMAKEEQLPQHQQPPPPQTGSQQRPQMQQPAAQTAAAAAPSTASGQSLTPDDLAQAIDSKVMQVASTLQESLMHSMRVQMETMAAQLSAQLTLNAGSGPQAPAPQPHTAAAGPQPPVSSPQVYHIGESTTPPSRNRTSPAMTAFPSGARATGATARPRTALKEQAQAALSRASNDLAAATAHSHRTEVKQQRLQRSREDNAPAAPPPPEAKVEIVIDPTHPAPPQARGVADNAAASTTATATSEAAQHQQAAVPVPAEDDEDTDKDASDNGSYQGEL